MDLKTVNGINEQNSNYNIRMELRRRQGRKGIRDHLRVFCFQNPNSSFLLVVIVFILKLVMISLYVARSMLDDIDTCNYCGTTEGAEDGYINWNGILWIQKPISFWSTEVAISIYTWVRMLIVTYLRFRGSILKIFTLNLCFETAMSVPVILTLTWEPLRQFYLPTFLNCWLAKRMLDQNVLSHRRMRSLSLFTQKLVAVVTTLLCLVFTGACGVQHIQRGSKNNFTLFESFYFVMVTLSTVGYGDFSPDIWPSRLFVIILIIIAVITIPNQVESLASSWVERQRRGGSYGKSAGSEAKHVVFCCTVLTSDILDDFLNEFFSHRHLQDYYVVFMSPNDPDPAARRVLQSPLWLHRCMSICGSCLNDDDLARAGVQHAKAFFLLGESSITDKATSDQHTILRAWAVKDYAPKVNQLVQLFHPENSIHVKFSKHTVIEDELKFTMLAYNCIVPATSTLLTLLLHTSKGEEGKTCAEPWLKLYGRHSGNEFYAIKLCDSLIFSVYLNINFTTASLQAHKRHGVLLIGVQYGEGLETILLNPGPTYILKATDICFYLSIIKEEDMDFKPPRTGKPHNAFSSNIKKVQPCHALHFSQNQLQQSANSFDNVVQAPLTGEYRSVEPRWVIDAERCEIRVGFLPQVPYVGMSKILCHLRKEKKKPCCLVLAKPCKHYNFSSVKEYNWAKKIVILVADSAESGCYHFISTLRSYCHPLKQTKPIVLLLKEKPSDHFLDVISWFPLVYFMIGNLSNTDDMITAGINIAEDVVVVGRELSTSSTPEGSSDSIEDSLADCSHIVTIQMLKRYFPSVKFTTELLQSSNMRFMQFQASDSECANYLAEVEKHEKEQGSTLAFIFRAPFASGSVFTTSMMDSMLYQGFLKDYLSALVRGLLGIIQTPGSAFLTSTPLINVVKQTNITFGQLFSLLINNGGSIPMAIYRTQNMAKEQASQSGHERRLMRQDSQSADITNLIKNRMKSMGLAHDEYEHIKEQADCISYPLINPRQDLQLYPDDIIVLLCPSPQKQIRKMASI